MPQSKNRAKARKNRYQLEPQRRKPAKQSPRWYGPLVLSLIAVGVGMIIWNYLQGADASNTYLWAGLGLIAVGFFGTMFWR